MNQIYACIDHDDTKAPLRNKSSQTTQQELYIFKVTYDYKLINQLIKLWNASIACGYMYIYMVFTLLNKLTVLQLWKTIWCKLESHSVVLVILYLHHIRSNMFIEMNSYHMLHIIIKNYFLDQNWNPLNIWICAWKTWSHVNLISLDHSLDKHISFLHFFPSEEH